MFTGNTRFFPEMRWCSYYMNIFGRTASAEPWNPVDSAWKRTDSAITHRVFLSFPLLRRRLCRIRACRRIRLFWVYRSSRVLQNTSSFVQERRRLLHNQKLSRGRRPEYEDISVLRVPQFQRRKACPRRQTKSSRASYILFCRLQKNRICNFLFSCRMLR